MDSTCISFASLGLVVLDEIRCPHSKPLTDVVGGSGAYATLGARLFLPYPISASLGWMLHIGADFPDSTQAQLESWKTTLIVRKELDKLSTRGLLNYRDTTFGPKDFRYTTPILAVDDEDLATTALLQSEVFHYLEAPQSIGKRVSRLLHRRSTPGERERPLIIWEPAPPSCRPENLQTYLDAVQWVDVFSPNHLELLALNAEVPPIVFDRSHIEDLAFKFVQNQIGPDGRGVMIVRAGDHGCLIIARDISPTWLPPFYSPGQENEHDSKVVDPTGAGNAFLGAYAIGYVQTGDVIKAAKYGAVGASFAVEQVGMPERSNEGEEELWNGVSVMARLHDYTSRLKP